MNLKVNHFLVSFYQRLNLIQFTFIYISLTSCITQKKVEYMKDIDKNLKVFAEAEFPDYRLKPNDELFIQINSLDEGAANIFSTAVGQQPAGIGSITPYGASLASYSVDKEGYLLLPIIGNVLVKDKTLSQVSLMLKDSLNHVLNQPIVSVKLVNRYVSVLGEVTNPGHYAYSQDRLSIYDAIGLAGDITDYANLEKVSLIRNQNGENIVVNFNLTTTDILTSEFYYLRPNDIIYIKPLRRNKFWDMRQVPLTILLSAITTGLLIYEITSGN